MSELENFDILLEQKMFLVNQGVIIQRFRFFQLIITELLNLKK
jgi:hypothetical protein